MLDKIDPEVKPTLFHGKFKVGITNELVRSQGWVNNPSSLIEVTPSLLIPAPNHTEVVVLTYTSATCNWRKRNKIVSQPTELSIWLGDGIIGIPFSI